MVKIENEVKHDNEPSKDAKWLISINNYGTNNRQ